MIAVGCALKLEALEYGAVIYKPSFTGRKLQADHSGTPKLSSQNLPTACVTKSGAYPKSGFFCLAAVSNDMVNSEKYT